MTADRAVFRAFQFGLGIFGLTILIGLANATKIFGELNRDTLLTHLHSGTLGWITMGVIAVAIWLFEGRGQTRAVTLSAIATFAYVLAFWSGNLPARAAFGVLELAVIVYWWWWVASRTMAEGFGRIDVPRLSVALGLTTLVIGSTLGVIVQVLLATASTTSPMALVSAHASAQVGGYLVLVGAGVAERILLGHGTRTRAGVAQVYLLFAAGLLLAVGGLLDILPLQMLATLLQVIAIITVGIRVGRSVISAPWGSASGVRHAAIAIPFLVVGLILLIAFLASIGQAQGDFTKVPLGLVHALDHAMFVGLMTNVLFAAALVLTDGPARPWPWADALIFIGLNLGAAAFIAVLVFVGSGYGAAQPHPTAYAASLMGLSALLGVGTLQRRVGVASRATQVAPVPA